MSSPFLQTVHSVAYLEKYKRYQTSYTLLPLIFGPKKCSIFLGGRKLKGPKIKGIKVVTDNKKTDVETETNEGLMPKNFLVFSSTNL